ncbi:Tigger transposable element-derived protein 1 [Anthophora retusa]
MSDIKLKRKAISLETKIKILDRLRNGEGSTALGKTFGLNEATIRTIKKNEIAIRQSVISGTNLSVKSSSYTRDAVKEKMEKALIIRLEENAQKRIPVDGNNIKQQALSFYKMIKDEQPSTSTQTTAEKSYVFSASTGWMRGFLHRHALHNIKIKGEIASGDQKAAEEYQLKLKKIIADGGYSPDQVFNADETSLFWKKMPRRTYVAKSQKSAGGFKVEKDRVTFLLCSNASGDRMLKPLLINRALKPRAMKGVDFDTLPVNWMANKKAWVTTTVFTEWFIKYFVPETRKYLNEKGLEFKVLLLVDNAPGHPQLEHENVQVLFLPPNTTSLIQPLDQGIIATFKTYYIKRTFQYILDTLDRDKTLTVIDAWKKFSIKDCVTHAALALSDLRPSTLNGCWRAIWPECVNSKNPVEKNTNEYPNIIALAHAVGGEGFDDLVSDDIDELMIDKVLSEDEILHFASQNADVIESSDSEEPVKLTENLIQEGLQLANKLGHHFVKNDPNVERAAQFQRELNSCMARYKELYKEVARIGEQRLITEFIFQNVDAERARESPVQNYSSDDSECIRVRSKRMRITDDDSN